MGTIPTETVFWINTSQSMLSFSVGSLLEFVVPKIDHKTVTKIVTKLLSKLHPKKLSLIRYRYLSYSMKAIFLNFVDNFKINLGNNFYGNFLGSSKFFGRDQKLINILFQSQTFYATPKDDFHSINSVFVLAQKILKKH